jgi:hypothetical protein
VTLSKPLDNYPLIRSRNIEEVRGALARVYAKPDLTPASKDAAATFNTSFNNCRLRNVELAYGSFGAAVSLKYPPTEFFSLLFPVHGTGEIVTGGQPSLLLPGGSTVVSANTDHGVRYSPDYEHLVLRINAKTLTDKLIALTGASITAPLRMHPQQTIWQPAAQMLEQYIPLLVETVSQTNPPFPNWWIAQTEQLLMVMCLCSRRHNYSHLLERQGPDAAPWQVRRAEEYIEANAAQVVTLEQLAELTGVSAFSLFRSFKRSRGYSPHEFLRQLRSRRAIS